MRYITLLAALFIPLSAYAADNHGHNKKVIFESTRTVADQEITVPEHPKVVASIVKLEPGESLPIHKHPYPRFAYVKKGELDLTLVDQKKKLHFKTGDFITEIIDGWHTGTNIGKETAELLVIDQLPQDVTNNVVIQDKAAH